MRVDSMVQESSRLGEMEGVAERARLLEEIGCGGGWMNETKYDPFLPLVVAAQATERMQLGTGIAVAFARSPMTVAVTAWDLQKLSRGRFILGLGSQVRPHIVRRFSMPWSSPVPRMREYVLALQAIWKCWQDGEPLDFHGESYEFTLMTPYFNPGPQPFGPPPIYLAAVNAGMSELAGEVAEGLKLHSFCTARYVDEVIAPAVGRGLEKSGRTREGFSLSVPVFAVIGETEADRERAAVETRRSIGFYASTAAYRAVLDVHGWGHVHEAARAAVRRGEWDDLDKLIDDEILHSFAVVAAPDEVGARFAEMYRGVSVDRVSLNLSSPLSEEAFIESLRSFAGI